MISKFSIMIRVLFKMIFFVGLVALIPLTVLPQEAVPHTGLSDKAAHTAAYAALASAGGIAFRGTRSLFLLATGLLALGPGLSSFKLSSRTALPGVRISRQMKLASYWDL